MSEETIGNSASRLDQANQILALFAPQDRIVQERGQLVVVQTRNVPLCYQVPRKPKRIGWDLCERGFHGGTYSHAIENLILWVLDLPRAPLVWWERATGPGCSLGRENGATIVECLRETDYEAPDA